MIPEFTEEKGRSIPAQVTMTSGGGDLSLPHSQKQRLQLADQRTADRAGCSKAVEMGNFHSVGKGWPNVLHSLQRGRKTLPDRLQKTN